MVRMVYRVLKICYRGQQVFLKSAESQRKNKTAKRRSKFSQGTRYLPLTSDVSSGISVYFLTVDKNDFTLTLCCFSCDNSMRSASISDCKSFCSASYPCDSFTNRSSESLPLTLSS